MDLLKPGNPRRVMLGMCLHMWAQLYIYMYKRHDVRPPGSDN